ncbi:MAG: hypothetical protein FH758_12330 [Firmicutes bacterium]|nr:hypothetical protein [Bacillota bacterium]
MFFHHGYGINGFLMSLMMIILMALPLIILVWMTFYLFDKYKEKNEALNNITDQKQNLNMKLAYGEISIKEYRRIKRSYVQSYPLE